jgi:hypothetical protein
MIWWIVVAKLLSGFAVEVQHEGRDDRDLFGNKLDIEGF